MSPQLVAARDNATELSGWDWSATAADIDRRDVRRPECKVRRSWTRVMHYDADLPAALIERLWRLPDAVTDEGRRMIHAPRGRVTQRRVTARIECEGQQLVIKRYGERGLRHYLARAVQQTRAQQVWQRTRRLVAAGVSTPPAVAFVDNRFGPLRGESHLLYRFVPGCTLREVLLTGSFDAEIVEDLAWQLSKLYRQIDYLGYSHTDMHSSNLVVDELNRLWMIDLDAMRYHPGEATMVAKRRRGLRKIMRDLQRMPEVADVFARHLEVESF